MSTIRCPYCKHVMELKGAKPGRYHPRCRSCKEKFALVVPENVEQTPVAQVIHRSVLEQVPTFIDTVLGLESAGEALPAKVARQAASAPAQTVASAQMAASAQTAAPIRPVMKTLPPDAPRMYAATAPPPAGATMVPAADAPGKTAPVDGSSPTLVPVEPVGITAPPSDLPTREVVAEPPPPDEAQALTGKIGGYQLLKKLGQGGMGSVYLANQLSLNRNVALKVLLEQLAANAQFVARFIREAYAAAQLTHHNVVQIHDIGAQKRTHFFSMEFVEGQTLAGLVREQGRLDPEVAVSYVLQAARGLKFAHDHDMIHRDIKPENLLLNRHGIVKVADLGLVKTADADNANLTLAAAARQAAAEGRWYDDENTTQLNVSMGTPAYMPPEQARDAAHVDARADIYALGCTLYALLVGRPPFTGKTAIEVITKHLKEPVRPPDQLVEHVPAYLSQIILKMMAKRPEDRYRDMDEVIEALEDFLGVETSGPFSPKPEQATAIENCVSWFNNSGWAQIRRRLIQAFLPMCAVVFVAVLVLPISVPAKFAWASGVVGFSLLTPVMYQLLIGYTRNTYLFFKARELVLGSGIVSMVMWLAVLVLLAALLVLLEMHWIWLGAGAAAAIVATAFHFAVDPAVDGDRQGPLERAELLLKQARRTAVSEAALRQFVCKYAGEQWEEFFEALFGYEAKMLARQRWGKAPESIGRGGKGDRGRPRPTYAAWRDPIIRWIDARQRARKEARDRRMLEQIERESLKARGFPETAARKKARYIAETIVVKAAELHEHAVDKSMEVIEKPPAGQTTPQDQQQEAGTQEQAETEREQRRSRQRRPVLDEEGLEGWEHLSYFQRRYGGWPGFFLGPAVRFVLGALLLTGGLIWAKQNDLLPTSATSRFVAAEVDRSIDQTAGKLPVNAVGTRNVVASEPTPVRETTPLKLAIVPRFLSDWFTNWNPAIAGLLLIVSAFFTGPKLGLFIVPAALIAVVGVIYLPAVAMFPPAGVALILMALLAAVGLHLARE